ncbi:TonB family protein [Labrenzia sp. CE80]|uniref:TonB family protein n=1 Tax=Labrenzia sp. CE80 TaxID=1788986 RepID=UPI00129A35D9|nr:TonB family protein [Labrenzia sp. CE80]
MSEAHHTPHRWRWLTLLLVVSLGIHVAFAAWAMLKDDEVLMAGGAESPAVTVGQAFADMIVAGSEMTETAPEEIDTEKLLEPEPPEEVQAIKPREIETSLEEPVETQAKQVSAAPVTPALTSTIVNARSEGAFVQSEKTLDAPIEAQPVEEAPLKPSETQPQETSPLKPQEPLRTVQPVVASPVQNIQESSEPVETKQVATKTAETPFVPPQQQEAVLKPEVSEVEPEKVEPLDAEPLETEPLETAELSENPPSDAIPVPQLRPKPLVQDLPKPTKTAQKTPKKAKKAKKKQSSPAGAGGNSNQTAQKGGAKNSGKGSSAGNAKVSNYPGKVARKLRRSLRYPSAAKRKRLTGNVHVSFSVDSAGRASRIRIARSSGSSILDKAAVETVRRASPFPKIPPEAQRKRWAFTVPLAFRR